MIHVALLHYILGLEEMVHPDSLCPQVLTDFFPRILSWEISIIKAIPLNRCFIVCWQLSALLRPTNNPWQPDVRHHLHSAQRPNQDRLRSAPSRAFYVTTTSIGHPYCGLWRLWSGFTKWISAVLLNRINISIMLNFLSTVWHRLFVNGKK